MKKKTNLQLLVPLIAGLLILVSCGTSSKRTLSDTSIQSRTVILEGQSIEIFQDDTFASRRNADKIFDAWAKKSRLKKSITGKRLLSISPKSDGCHLTYDFRLIDGKQQRITLVVPSYTNGYNGKRRNGSARANINHK